MSIPVKHRLLLPGLSWLCVFFLLPLALIVLVSVSSRGPDGGFSWGFDPANYRRLADPLYLAVVGRSILLAGISTAVCAALAFPVAYWMARMEKRRQGLMVLLVLIPFWTNILVRLYAWMFILGRSGLMNSVLLELGVLREPVEVLFTRWAVVLGLVYGQLPFMILPLYANLSRLDLTLLEAAADLGCRPWRAFLRVTLPLSLPGILAGSLLVFIPVVGEFVIPDLLGGPDTLMVGRMLWTEFFSNKDWPLASALALVLLALLVVPFVALQRWQARLENES